MKKQLVIIGIVAILVSVGLSGCNQQQPTYTPPKTYLNGWYYSYLAYSCEPFDNYSFYKEKTLDVFFLTNENTIKIRLIAYKNSSEDIKISIRTPNNITIHTFETSYVHLDEGYVFERSDSSGHYILFSENGDVHLTVLEYFSNVDSYSVRCGIPVKYIG